MEYVGVELFSNCFFTNIFSLCAWGIPAVIISASAFTSWCVVSEMLQPKPYQSCAFATDYIVKMNITELIFTRNILCINKITCIQLYEQCTGEKQHCKQICCSKFHINVEYREQFIYTCMQKGCMWWCSWLRQCATSRPHYGPGVDSTSRRNEYQEYFLGGKGGRSAGLANLPPSCVDCL